MTVRRLFMLDDDEFGEPIHTTLRPSAPSWSITWATRLPYSTAHSGSATW